MSNVTHKKKFGDSNINASLVMILCTYDITNSKRRSIKLSVKP